MKTLKLFIIIILAFSCSLSAQNKEEKEKAAIYNPTADAAKDIEAAVKLAKEQQKHVLIQIGGNWCPWCIKVHKFLAENALLDSIMKADYIFVLVNYSKENRNYDILKKFEYPQRFGFPVFIVLDGDGKRLHTQDSGFLEKEDSYDLKKMKIFLLTWNKGALNPGKYEEK